MSWEEINRLEDLEALKKNSGRHLIFKHSTRCSLSYLVKNRLNSSSKDLQSSFQGLHYLDLIKYREISHAVANAFGVKHESPQVIILENGKPIWDESHLAISSKAILNALE